MIHIAIHSHWTKCYVPLRFILLHEAEYKKLVVILVDRRCSTLGEQEYLRRKHKSPPCNCSDLIELMRDKDSMQSLGLRV